MNYPKMDQAKVRELLAEGRLHLNFMCSIYRRQQAKGKYYLHEHPATALSWKEDAVEALARHPLSKVVVADQCRYGLVTPSADDPTKMLPAMKPTKFLTNSVMMASQLNLRCRRDHKHQPLVSGRCKDASYCPAPLVRAILKGIAQQAEHDRQMTSAVRQSDELLVSKVLAIPMSQPKCVAPVPWGQDTTSSVPRMKGGTVPITYRECNFRERYYDEYTGELLPRPLIRAAIEDELNYFNSKVWQLSTIDDMMRVTDHVLA